MLITGFSWERNREIQTSYCKEPLSAADEPEVKVGEQVHLCLFCIYTYFILYWCICIVFWKKVCVKMNFATACK